MAPRSAPGSAEGHEPALGAGVAVEDFGGEDGHEDEGGGADEADEAEQEEDVADGFEIGGIFHAFFHFDQDMAVFGGLGFFDDAHHEQGDDDGDVADAVEGEAPAFADPGDQHAGDGGAEEAGEVEHAGVEGDGVGEIFAFFDELHDEGLAGGDVEGVDEALEGGEAEEA